MRPCLEWSARVDLWAGERGVTDQPPIFWAVAYLLFLDESGHDLKQSPYEVLAGVAVEDRHLWPLICAIQDAEVEFFGRRYAGPNRELKAKKLLKTKTFRQAAWEPPIPDDERRALAKTCLDDGAGAPPRALAALAQAKLAFVTEVLKLCERYTCAVLASAIDRDSPRLALDFLRKDYAYLFERYFYLLDGKSDDHFGLVVFDELEKSQSNILIDQLARYFRETNTGKQRAGKIIPEPFFVHSDLTTGVQVADLVAYLIAWNVRVRKMHRPRRPELDNLGRQVEGLCFESARKMPHRRKPFVVHSVAHIVDLRPRKEWIELGLPLDDS